MDIGDVLGEMNNMYKKAEKTIMRRVIISIILIMCFVLNVGCGEAKDEEMAVPESSDVETSVDEYTEEYQEESSDTDTSDELDPLHYSGDREVKKDTWGVYEFSRPISYTEMTDIFRDYYEGYRNLDESLDYDAFIEADQILSETVAEKYNLTYDEFMNIFGILANDDMVAIKKLYN